MIYCGNCSPPEISEVIYLEEEFDVSVSSNIHVNPDNPTYVIGKIVIINSLLYPVENIRILQENRCKIISRISIPEVEDLEVAPYILRPCFDIMWNGKEVKDPKENWLDSDKNFWEFIVPDYKLYFPKVITPTYPEPLKDEGDNFTWLGWLLQQVGQNIKEDTVFLDLDLMKTKKMDLGKG